MSKSWSAVPTPATKTCRWGPGFACGAVRVAPWPEGRETDWTPRLSRTRREFGQETMVQDRTEYMAGGT